MDGLRQQTCSHQPTAHVGHSRSFFAAILTVWRWTKSRWDGWILPKWGWDEPEEWALQYDVQRNTLAWWTSIIAFKTSFNNNIRDEYCDGPWLTDGPLGWEDRNGGNMLAPEVHKHWRDVQPFSTPQAAAGLRPVWAKEGPEALYRASRIGCEPLIARGGRLTCYVYVKARQC